MFFVLSKILFYVLMPLTWILVFLFIAIFSKKEERRKKSLVTGVVLLLFFTNPFICNEAWLLWEHPPTAVNKLGNYDAAIVLTGITNQDKSPKDRVYINRGADRVLMPLRLYKEGKIKKIIISGGSGSLKQRESMEADELKQILLQSGVPADAIIVENKSRNTHENASFTKAVLSQHPELKKLLLVTSAFHIRRADGCFKKQGIKADVFSVDFYTTNRSFSFDEIIPQEQALYYWQKLFHEVLGYLVYKMMGYC